MGPQTWDFKSGQLSDLGSQVWTAVKLRAPGRTNPRSKIQAEILGPDPRSKLLEKNLGSRAEILDPDTRSKIFKKLSWIQGRNLGSKWDCWIQGFPTQVFQNLRSWILDPDPRFLPWIQDLFFENLGYWILIMSDLRFSSLNPFQTGDSQVTETGIKPKSKAWTSKFGCAPSR